MQHSSSKKPSTRAPRSPAFARAIKNTHHKTVNSESMQIVGLVTFVCIALSPRVRTAAQVQGMGRHKGRPRGWMFQARWWTQTWILGLRVQALIRRPRTRRVVWEIRGSVGKSRSLVLQLRRLFSCEYLRRDAAESCFQRGEKDIKIHPTLRRCQRNR